MSATLAKKGADSTGKVMHRLKERLVCNEEASDGRSRVTTDEVRVL